MQQERPRLQVLGGESRAGFVQRSQLRTREHRSNCRLSGFRKTHNPLLPPKRLPAKENASPEGTSSAATAKLVLFLPILKLVSWRSVCVCLTSDVVNNLTGDYAARAAKVRSCFLLPNFQKPCHTWHNTTTQDGRFPHKGIRTTKQSMRPLAPRLICLHLLPRARSCFPSRKSSLRSLPACRAYFVSRMLIGVFKNRLIVGVLEMLMFAKYCCRAYMYQCTLVCSKLQPIEGGHWEEGKSCRGA